LATEQLADYCEWLPDGSRRPCYAPAALVLVRPDGETLRFSCAEHRDAWAARIRGPYLVLGRDEWEARGAGYRGVMLGG
jgi:hypothetical protein